tara:strand:+ start:879 stop:2645 length:1767 start_codon:yes stop_codon:yes gene_type:complete
MASAKEKFAHFTYIRHNTNPSGSGEIWEYTNTKTGQVQKMPFMLFGAKGNPKMTFKLMRKQMSNIQKFMANKNLVDSLKKDLAGPPLYETFKKPAKYNISKKSGKKQYFQEKGEAPRALANKWSLMRYRGTPMTSHTNKDGISKDEYKKAQVFLGNGDVPKNPSGRTIIVECAKLKDSPGYQYKYSDFIFTKYYGKIANNQMLTLRRFPFPCEDNIIRPKKWGNNGKSYSSKQNALAQAVTWMGEKPGNQLNAILKFTVGYNWKDAESKMQEINSQPRDRGKLGGFLDSMPFSENIQGGLAGESAATTYRRKQQGGGWDPMKQTYPNHSLVPLNIIKSVRVREAGLTFSQEFKLQFEYDMKGVPGVSPKIAFLDVLSNLLILTYTTAPFWGGAVRYTGGGKKGQPFGDLKKLQSGDIKGFLGTVVKDLAGMVTNGVKDLMKGGDSKILNNVLGGALMDLLGGPQGGQVAAAFLSGDATGNWHLTIGNPLNPIAVIGNLTCENAEFEFDGPLGYEDFPSKLKVTITCKPARPRDKSDIESMFNAGRGRMYITEAGTMDPNESYDVDAYGRVYGDKKANAARQASKFSNG